MKPKSFIDECIDDAAQRIIDFCFYMIEKVIGSDWGNSTAWQCNNVAWHTASK